MGREAGSTGRIKDRFAMARPATTNPATAREIIVEIVRNMREGLDPLQYSRMRRCRPVSPHMPATGGIRQVDATGTSRE